MAIIEGAVSLGLIVLTLSLSLQLSYMNFAKFWLNHNLYEAIICTQEQKGQSFCQREYKRRSIDLLPLGQLHEFRVEPIRAAGIWRWELAPFDAFSNRLRRVKP